MNIYVPCNVFVNTCICWKPCSVDMHSKLKEILSHLTWRNVSKHVAHYCGGVQHYVRGAVSVSCLTAYVNTRLSGVSY